MAERSFIQRYQWPILIVSCLVCFGAGVFMGWGRGGSGTSEQAPAQGPVAEAQEWTCSMHPNIRQPKPGKCPICFMALIPVTSGGGDAGERRISMSKVAKKLAGIQTTQVVRELVERDVRLVGKLAYDETRIKTISSYVDGRLERLFVDYTGTLVRKGDHLVEIYSPEILVAAEELQTAKQAVADASRASVRSAAESILESTREKLRLWGLTDEQIKAVETGGAPSDRVTIYSPIGGIVIEKHAKEGMYVKTGSPVYTVADLSRLWLMMEAYETDLPWLRYGQEVEFEIQLMPGEIFVGKIAFIDPVLDPKTRTASVRVNVPNSDRRLKPEMFARATVHVKLTKNGQVVEPALAGKWISPMHPEIVKDGPGKCDVCGMDLVPAEDLGFTSLGDDEAPLVIPASAVMFTGKRSIVYVEVPGTEQPTFEGREIRLGPRAGEYYVVREGELKPGERVVTNGTFKIDSALQLAAKPSMMSVKSGSLRAEDEQLGVPPEFLTALNPLYESSFDAQKALAGDDFGKAKDAMARVADAAGKPDAAVLRGRARALWRKLTEDLGNAAQDGAEAKDIAAARQAFRRLSKTLLKLEKQFGHAGDKDHVEAFCPMAFDNEGASWLQLGDEIFNPYYGSKMLHCGDVRARHPSLAGGKEPSTAQTMKAAAAPLALLFQSYLALQEALAADDDAKAKAESAKLSPAFDTIHMKQFEGELHVKWMALLPKLKDASIAVHSAKEIKARRKAFEDLSNLVLELADHFGNPTAEPLFKAHCPMAFDNKGADWLQRGETINNPYYGAMMLRCGGLKKTYTAGAKAQKPTPPVGGHGKH